jgi:hypothetical protein
MLKLCSSGMRHLVVNKWAQMFQINLLPLSSRFKSEDGGSKFLKNVDTHIPHIPEDCNSRRYFEKHKSFDYQCMIQLILCAVGQALFLQ